MPLTKYKTVVENRFYCNHKIAECYSNLVYTFFIIIYSINVEEI